MNSPAPASVSIPLPGVDIRRPTTRKDKWVVSVGAFAGSGPTLAAAKDHLARQILNAAAASVSGPAFGRDDDGALIVVSDHPWGLDTYRITDEGYALLSTSRRRNPAEEITACHHYTPIPPRRATCEPEITQ